MPRRGRGRKFGKDKGQPSQHRCNDPEPESADHLVTSRPTLHAPIASGSLGLRAEPGEHHAAHGQLAVHPPVLPWVLLDGVDQGKDVVTAGLGSSVNLMHAILVPASAISARSPAKKTNQTAKARKKSRSEVWIGVFSRCRNPVRVVSVLRARPR